jgi:ABC-type nitrate/sulfonate/bicarbonate transport system substrate-binding protein
MVLGRVRRLFDGENLDVEITATPNSTDQMRGLGAGTWDIASTAFDNVLGWSGREGAEIVAVAHAISGVSLPLCVRPEIREWSDLRGRRLAVDAVDTAYALVLRRILLAHGLDLQRGDYELVPVGATGSRFESMKQGDTFAGILNPPWNRKAQEAGMVQFSDHREVLPDYPGGVYAVSREWAKGHRDELMGFLRALSSAGNWASDPANREEAIRLLAAEEKVSEEAAAASLKQTPGSDGLNLAGLQVVLDLRVQFGLTPPMGPDLSRYYDLTYYQAAVG